MSSHAAPIVFSFNDATLPDGAGNAAVQTYMQTVLSNAGLPSGVTVTGTMVEKNYTGDLHVVGPVSGTTVTSLTLGNSDANVQHGIPLDGYIYNSNTLKFTMTFPFPIFGVSFDYEIFPNANCANPPGTCSVPPDFRLRAGNPSDSLPLTSYLYKAAVDPNLVPINGYQHSPFSGASANEQASQWLGVSGNIALPGVRILEFYDWPERVGIDNLAITVPEPGTMLLFGAGLAGLWLGRRKQSA